MWIHTQYSWIQDGNVVVFHILYLYVCLFFKALCASWRQGSEDTQESSKREGIRFRCIVGPQVGIEPRLLQVAV